MRLWWQKSSSPQLRISLRHSLSLGLVACPTLSRVSISGCSVGTIANERDETHEREFETGVRREDGTGPEIEREETDPVTDPEKDAGVDLETEITGDPKMIAEEVDRKNENPRSITEDHLQVISCEELSIMFCT